VARGARRVMREFLQTAQLTRGVEKDHPAERLIASARNHGRGTPGPA